MKQKVLVIASSSNKKGNSSFLASLFIAKANPDLYQFSLVNLYDLNIEYFSNENRTSDIEQNPNNQDARNLLDAIEDANKIVLAFPVWNLSVPAILKNFLDRAGVSGRAWSEQKKKKVANWKGKQFYLLLTMGSKWHQSLIPNLAVLHLYLVLKYYGAKVRVVKRAYNCGNGSTLVLADRKRLIRKMHRKSKRYWK